MSGGRRIRPGDRPGPVLLLGWCFAPLPRPTSRTSLKRSMSTSLSVSTPRLARCRRSRPRLHGRFCRRGMGAVYEARDLLLQCTVAVKTLENVLATSSNSLDLLRRELLIARRVTHANVARVFDCHEGASGLFMTLEFLEGETLAERQLRASPVPLAEVFAVLRHPPRSRAPERHARCWERPSVVV